jgi:uncharacterized RDD family membrane protein YckC
MAMMTEEVERLEYVGFWKRVGAAVIDTLLIVFITMPLLLAIYGKKYFAYPGLIAGPADFLITWVLPAVAVIVFWVSAGATPGKMAMSARIVDAESGGAISVGQSVIRYLGYFVSMIPLFVGLIWVAFDARKQGWHDKIAGTVVISPKQDAAPVQFRARHEGIERKEPRL